MPALNHWVMKRALKLMDIQRVVHPRIRLLVHQTLASVAAPHWLSWFRDQIVQHNLVRLPPLLEFQIDDVHRNLETDGPLPANLRKYGMWVCIANYSGTPSELETVAEMTVALAKRSFRTLPNTQ